MRRRLAFLVVPALLLFVGPGAATADTLDQQQTSHEGFIITECCALGQTFTAGLSGGLDRVELYLGSAGLFGLPSLASPLKIEVRTVEENGAPSAMVIASQTVPASSVPESGAFVPIAFAPPPHVLTDTQYAIVAYEVVPAGNFTWFGQNGNPYPRGSAWTSVPPFATWRPAQGEFDLAFKTYVTTSPTNKEQCKNGGWEEFTGHNGTPFKNQGACVSDVASGGS